MSSRIKAIGFDWGGVIMTASQATFASQVDERVLGLIRGLRERGFKTGLLSNASLEGAQLARAVDLDVLFDAVVFSGEIGYMKPDPRAFQELTRRLDVDMSELVFIDDAEQSLSTAGELGYTPILYMGFEGLVQALQNVGIALGDEKKSST